MPDRAPPGPTSGLQARSREEIDALYAAAQKEEKAEDARRAKLMAHWTYAVCIGCGPAPKPFKPVVTNPLRVLAGIPAWVDDERTAVRGASARAASVRRRVAGL